MAHYHQRKAPSILHPDSYSVDAMRFCSSKKTHAEEERLAQPKVRHATEPQPQHYHFGGMAGPVLDTVLDHWLGSKGNQQA